MRAQWAELDALAARDPAGYAAHLETMAREAGAALPPSMVQQLAAAAAAPDAASGASKAAAAAPARSTPAAAVAGKQPPQRQAPTGSLLQQLASCAAASNGGGGGGSGGCGDSDLDPLAALRAAPSKRAGATAKPLIQEVPPAAGSAVVASISAISSSAARAGSSGARPADAGSSQGLALSFQVGRAACGCMQLASSRHAAASAAACICGMRACSLMSSSPACTHLQRRCPSLRRAVAPAAAGPAAAARPACASS